MPNTTEANDAWALLGVDPAGDVPGGVVEKEALGLVVGAIINKGAETQTIKQRESLFGT